MSCPTSPCCAAAFEKRVVALAKLGVTGHRQQLALAVLWRKGPLSAAQLREELPGLDSNHLQLGQLRAKKLIAVFHLPAVAGHSWPVYQLSSIARFAFDS